MALTLRRRERDGLVRRGSDPGDGRKARVHLTDHALGIRKDLQAQRALLDDLSLDGLNAGQRRALAEFLDVMASTLTAVNNRREPGEESQQGRP